MIYNYFRTPTLPNLTGKEDPNHDTSAQIVETRLDRTGQR